MGQLCDCLERGHLEDEPINLESERTVLLAQFAATLSLVGLLWFVQAVHYPLFARVGPDQFRDYEAAHMQWTTLVVMPPMLIEAASAVFLAWRPPAGVWPALCWAGVILLLVIWGSTALLQFTGADLSLR